MPQYNRNELEKAARDRGFVRDTFEKVLRLVEILTWINSHDHLSEHLILKGGKISRSNGEGIANALETLKFQLASDLDCYKKLPGHDFEAFKSKNPRNCWNYWG